MVEGIFGFDADGGTACVCGGFVGVVDAHVDVAVWEDADEGRGEGGWLGEVLYYASSWIGFGEEGEV